MIEELLAALSSGAPRWISDESGRISNAELAKLVDRYSEELRRLNVPSRARVSFSIRNSISHVALLLACWKERLLVFLLPPGSSPSQIDFITKHLSPYLYLVDDSTASFFDPNRAQRCAQCGDVTILRSGQHVEELDPLESIADVGIMTSGSMGTPKAVLHSLDRILENARRHADAISIDAADTVACFLPLHFSYGLVASLIAAILRQSSIALSRPDADRAAENARQHGVTILSSTPYLSRKLLKADIPSLRVLTIGGDSLDPTNAGTVVSHFSDVEIYATYGLTEAGPRVATCRLDLMDFTDLLALPLGNALKEVKLEISPEGDEGELVVETPTAMLGYFGDRALSKATLIGPHRIKTGDLFRRLNGNLYFLGRKKRILSRGGEKVFPALIENRLKTFRGVEDVWVEGYADTLLGEVPQAYVVSRNKIEERELGRFIRSVLPGSHVPTRFTFVETLPAHVRRK